MLLPILQKRTKGIVLWFLCLISHHGKELCGVWLYKHSSVWIFQVLLGRLGLGSVGVDVGMYDKCIHIVQVVQLNVDTSIFRTLL